MFDDAGPPQPAPPPPMEIAPVAQTLTGMEEPDDFDDPPARQQNPNEFDVERALKRQAVIFVDNYDRHNPPERTEDMLQITIKIDGGYDATKTGCAFGSLIVANATLCGVLEMFIRVTETLVKPTMSKQELDGLMDHEREELYSPKVIVRLWRGQNENSGCSAYTIYIKGGRKDPRLSAKIDERFTLLKETPLENIEFQPLASILRNYAIYCYGKAVGNTTEKLKFLEIFSYQSTKYLLSGKKFKLDGGDGDDCVSDMRSYVPDGDYILVQNQFYFWECIREVPFFWIGRSLLEDAVSKLMHDVARTLRHGIQECITNISSIAEKYAAHWARWMTADEAKKHQADSEARAAEANRREGLLAEEAAAEEEERGTKKRKSVVPFSLIQRERAEVRKLEKSRLIDSYDRIWTLNVRAMRHFQYLNGPIEAVTEAYKMLVRDVEEAGERLSDDNLDDYFNEVLANPSVQARLPNAILGAWSQMREPKISHRYPFILHWSGHADIVSEIRKNFLDLFGSIFGNDNCTAMSIELNMMRLTSTDIGRVMPQNSIFQGPASAGKTRTAEIIKKMSCPGTIVCNAIQSSDKAEAVAINPFDFAMQIYTDTGERLTKDPKTLSAKEQETVTKEQILRSDQKMDYTVHAAKATEKNGDMFLARDVVHIECWQRGPTAYVSNRGLGKAEMRARVQEFQIGIATTQAMNMMSSVIAEGIDKSLSDGQAGVFGKKDVSTDEMILENDMEGRSYQAAALMNGIYKHVVENDRHFTMPADIIALQLVRWMSEEYRGMQKMSNSVRNPRRMEGCLKKIHANAFLRAYALLHWMLGGKYKFDPTKRDCFYINNIGKYLRDLAQQQIGSTCEAIHAVATMLPDLCDEILARILKTIQRDFLQIADFNLTTKGGRAKLCEALHGRGSSSSSKVQFKKEKKQSPFATATQPGQGNAQNNSEQLINPNYIEYHTELTPEQFCKSIATKTGVGVEISSDAVHQKLFQDEKGKLLKDWGVSGVRPDNAAVGEDGSDAVELENCGLVLKPINIFQGTDLKSADQFMNSFAEDPAKPQILRFGYHKAKNIDGEEEYIYTFAASLFDGNDNCKSPAALLKQIIEEKLPYKNQMVSGIPEIDAEQIKLYIERHHPDALDDEEEYARLKEHYAEVGIPIHGHFLDYTDHVVAQEFCIRPTAESHATFSFSNPRFDNMNDEKLIVNVIEDVHANNAYIPPNRTAARARTVAQSSGYEQILDHLRRKKEVTIGVSMDMLAWWPLAHRYRWTKAQLIEMVLREPRALVATWASYKAHYKLFMPVLMKNETRRARLREFARKMDLNPEEKISSWLRRIVSKIAQKSANDITKLCRRVYPVARAEAENIRDDHPSLRLLSAFLSFGIPVNDDFAPRALETSKIAAIDHEHPTEELAVIITAMETSKLFGGDVLMLNDIATDGVEVRKLADANKVFNQQRRRNEAENDAAFLERCEVEAREQRILAPGFVNPRAETRPIYKPRNSTMLSGSDAMRALGRMFGRPRGMRRQPTVEWECPPANGANPPQRLPTNDGFDLGSE